MKGDFTRRTFNPYRSYSSVQMQQGRVQLDSDWNEQAEIELYRERRMLRDIVGGSGVPWKEKYEEYPDVQFQFGLLGNRAFLLPSVMSVNDEFIARAYIEGVLVEQLFPSLDATLNAAPPMSTSLTIQIPKKVLANGRVLEPGMFVAYAREDEKVGNRWQVNNIGVISTVTDTTLTIGLFDSLSMGTTANPCKVVPLYEYKDQPFLKLAGTDGDLPTSDKYVAYLDIWRRHITAVEAPALRESALGGPDTATRTQTVWQMRLAKATPAAVADGTWLNTIKPKSPGWLKARYNPAPGQAQALENRLYRVEIHKGGAKPTDTPQPAVTFKWSRDNGSQAAPWIGNDNPVHVITQGRDEALNFVANQWIELSNDTLDLNSTPGALVQIVGSPTSITGGLALPIGSGGIAYDSDKGNPKVRRWDSAGAINAKPATADTWIPLENGIEVMFDQGATYQAGDYWLIPARPSQGGIEWPQSGGVPLPQPAQRTEHLYYPVTLIDFDATPDPVSTPLLDEFYPLRELTRRLMAPTIHYMSIIPVTQTLKNYNAAGAPKVTDAQYPNFVLARDVGPTFTYYLGGFDADNLGWIPISFPHKAKLLEMKVVASETGAVAINMYRCDITNTDREVVAYVNVSFTGGARDSKTNAVVPGLGKVDNEKYTYMIDFNHAGMECKIYAIIIKYEMPGPLAY